MKLENSQKSMFASAAEEMSFMRAEKKDFDLTKRKISDKSAMKTEAIDKIRAYLDKAKDLDKEKQLKPFFNQLQQTELSAKELKQKLLQQFKDPSQQYIALLYAKEQLKRKQKNQKLSAHEEALLATLDGQIDELRATQGPEIDAGLNISEVAGDFSTTNFDSINSLRQFYRDAVLDYGGLSATFRTIVEEHGDDNIEESLLFLVKALGADIASEGPSVPKERLQMIIDDMYKLQSLENIHEECAHLLAQITRIYTIEAMPKNSHLMEKLLSLLEQKWVTAQKIAQMTDQLNLHGDALEIFFLRGFKELMRVIPLKAFNDPFEREKVLNAIQEALDNKIDEEESKLEENDK